MSPLMVASKNIKRTCWYISLHGDVGD